MRDFVVGAERRLLFTLDPFYGVEPFPLPGPVFIHESECPRYPEDGGFPADLLAHRLTVTAFARGRLLRAEEHLKGPFIEETVARLLALPDVDYLHVLDTEAGCYDFRIERIPSGARQVTSGWILRSAMGPPPPRADRLP